MNLIKVGKIKDAQGLKGHVFLLIFSKDLSLVDLLDKIYLVRKDIPVLQGPVSAEVPSQVAEFRSELQQKKIIDGHLVFAVDEARIHKNGIVCLLEGMANRTQAEQLKGLEFYVEESLFESEVGETVFLKEILGFTLRDQEGEVRGEITAFSSNGPQDLLVVRSTQQKEFMIPFVEGLIQKIDFPTKTLFMIFPEGLDEI